MDLNWEKGIAKGLGFLVTFSMLFGAIFVLGMVIRFVMHSLKRAQQLTTKGLAWWIFWTVLFFMVFERLGRFFTLNVSLTHPYYMLYAVLLHMAFFTAAGLIARAFCARRRFHAIIAGKDAVIFLVLIALGYYFLLGTVAGALIEIARSNPESELSREIIKRMPAHLVRHHGLQRQITNE